jgi:Fe-S cluster biogenesis protein NfuA
MVYEAMLAFCSRSSTSFGRFFAQAVQKSIEDRCEELFETIIRPVLIEEGSDVVFHGVKDDCVIISVQGMADTIRSETYDEGLPEEILEVIQTKIPEIKYIRKKFLFED